MKKLITTVMCSALLLGTGFAFAADSTSTSDESMHNDPHKMDHTSKKPQEMKKQHLDAMQKGEAPKQDEMSKDQMDKQPMKSGDTMKKTSSGY